MGIFDTNFSEDRKIEEKRIDDEKRRALESDNPFETVKGPSIKALNERHVACVFLLDVSGSMIRGDAITKLNEGMVKFKQYMQNDSRIADAVDVSIVTLGSKVEVIQDFMPVSELVVPLLKANGQTNVLVHHISDHGFFV